MYIYNILIILKIYLWGKLKCSAVYVYKSLLVLCRKDPFQHLNYTVASIHSFIHWFIHPYPRFLPESTTKMNPSALGRISFFSSLKQKLNQAFLSGLETHNFYLNVFHLSCVSIRKCTSYIPTCEDLKIKYF